MYIVTLLFKESNVLLSKKSNTKGSLQTIFNSQHISWCAGFENELIF